MSGALRTLHDAGAHFVLCSGKVPIWRRWQYARPSLEVVEHHAEHGRSIGLVPASIGTSALDVDSGNPDELFAQWPARVVLPSRRTGRQHGYYDDTEARGNPKWEALGAAGEVRSGRGFLVLYRDAPARLATALQRPGRFPFPDSLFDAVGVRLGVQRAPSEQGPAIVAGRPAILPMLEVQREPGRNSALFDVVRWWAYSQDRGRDLGRWYATVTAYATTNNGRFPDPLEAPEVRKLAYCVAAWTWSGHGAFNHSPEAQRRRALKLGRMRRAATAKRDGAIVQNRAIGMSYRAIARKHKLTGRAVHYIVHRDAPLLGNTTDMCVT